MPIGSEKAQQSHGLIKELISDANPNKMQHPSLQKHFVMHDPSDIVLHDVFDFILQLYIYSVYLQVFARKSMIQPLFP